MATKIGKQDYEVIGFLEDNLDKIKINHDNLMYFFMTPLSDLPSSIIDDVNYVQIYTNTLTKFGFIDDESADEGFRAQALADFLKDNIIICTPKVKRSREHNKNYYQGDELELIRAGENFKRIVSIGDKLIPMPVFSAKRSVNEISDELSFEEKLFNRKLLGRVEHFSKDNDDYPLYVFWENEDGSRVLYGEIEGQNSSQYGIAYNIDPDNFFKVEIDESNQNIIGYDDYINNEENIIFVPHSMLQWILEKKQVVDVEFNNKATSMYNSITNTVVDSSVNNETNKSFSMQKHQQTKISEKSNNVKVDEKTEENELLERFNYITRKNKLYYSLKDLCNFHTAMLGDSLVVLSGLSGTGKSQLVTSYAKALQMQESQVKFISVRPFWEDDSDLLGYADTVNSVYRPGDSGLIDALIEASADSENLYMICFDEMNLARVEHYFSQFLSVLEMEPNSRYIKLYNEELENRLYNSASYPSTIKIGQNILFVGTINTDESTHQFSDKVLDRSNMISLEILPFHEVNKNISLLTDGQRPRNPIKYDDYKKFRGTNLENGLTNDEKEMFWKLHLLINAADKNVGIGWRILKQIDEYLKNLPNQKNLSRQEAIDMQIIQRILSKVRGSEEQLTELLGKWNRNKQIEMGTFEKILNEYQDTSTFERAKEVIFQKSRELNLHGFTI